MKLNTIQTNLVPFFICISLLTLAMGCKKDQIVVNEPQIEEVLNELKFSVQGAVYTEGIDFEFDILEGNGGYTVSVSPEESAKVTILENKVKIDLLSNSTSVTISDKKQKSRSVAINSTANSLSNIHYGIFINSGGTYTMKDLSFGAGGYTIEKIKGTSAEVFVLGSDHIKITGLKPGNSYYRIRDSRGSAAPLEVMVTSTFDLTDYHLEIAAVNDQIVSIIIKQGNGNWKLVEEPLSPIFEKITLMPKADSDKKYDVLQINTSKDDAKGIATVHLKYQAGNTASVTFSVQ